jgi:hypothetical protein
MNIRQYYATISQGEVMKPPSRLHSACNSTPQGYKTFSTDSDTHEAATTLLVQRKRYARCAATDCRHTKKEITVKSSEVLLQTDA